MRGLIGRRVEPPRGSHAAADRDLARLHRLWNDPLQADREQAADRWTRLFARRIYTPLRHWRRERKLVTLGLRPSTAGKPGADA